MAIHAAMVDRMDREIGRVLDQLRAMGAFENTLIFFLSDNGASAEIMVRDDGHDPSAPAGSAASHLCLGPGWSTVANTPFRRHKTWVHEGGIATPLIVHWPKGIAARGELRHDPGHVIDLVPTILEVRGRICATMPRTPGPSPRVPARAWCRPSPATAPSGTTTCGGHTKGTAPSAWATGSSSPPRRALGTLRPRDRPHRDARSRDSKSRQGPRTVRAVAAAHGRIRRDRPSAERERKQGGPADKPVKELILPGESFLVAGHPAFILTPAGDRKRTPQPWIFYAPTLPGYPDSHEKWMHEQFLAAGIAVAGIDVGEAYGSPEGRRLFNEFYRELTEKRGFAPRPCLLGRSRGGLWVTSWAIENPDKVAGIAGIYPVFDLTTYPGLDKAAPAYGLAAGQFKARLAEFNPIERVGVLAKHRVPAIFIHGDEDKVVPLKENSAEFVARYRAAGAGELGHADRGQRSGAQLLGGFLPLS